MDYGMNNRETIKEKSQATKISGVFNLFVSNAGNLYLAIMIDQL